MPKHAPVNNKTRLPIEHYQELFAKEDPDAMAARTGMRYDAGTQSFAIDVLGKTVLLHWPDMRADYLASGTAVRDTVRILLGCLFTHGRIVPGTGKFIAFNEVPWGDHYIDAFRRRCIQRLEKMFVTADDFSQACERMGGRSVAGGDAAYEFAIVPDVLVHLTFWEGDDEFPARAQITFSDNVSLAFTADELAYAGDVVLGSLQHAADEED